MQTYFYELADAITAGLSGGEVLLLSLSGEDSEFVRFNHSAIRQAGHVDQRYLSVELVVGNRHVKAVETLTGLADADRACAEAALNRLRRELPQVPEDPYLLYATEPVSGESVRPNRLPEPAVIVEAALQAGKGRDLVGLLAMGGVFAGFANSLGQRNWFATHSFHLGWSLYHAADKAVKTSCAGFQWDEEAMARKAATAVEQLGILARPPKTVPPGEYRMYLAPEALNEVMGLLAWGGFGLKDHRTKNTSLLKLVQGEASLAPAVTIRENTAEGMTANFQSSGFVKPDVVTLIDGGRFHECLVSPRSAREYGLSPNGASAWEYPQSLDMAGGDIAADDVLRGLDTGVYVNQLWYLNYSDRPACRMTGMTRFATFWVEGGRIVAPLNVMRFDETIYRMLGERLVGLTAQRDFLPGSDTYGGRSTDSARLPGAIVEGFRFTL